MAQSTVLLIINPVAGMMRGKAAMFPVVNTFCRNGYRVTTYVTARHGDARDIAYEEASSYDLVVCCGGDGTLNEVIDGILGGSHKTPLGYIPMGSTNDFANSLKLSSQPIKATQSIVNGSEKAIDVGLFNKKRHFTYIASFGAFTAASYNAPQTTKNALGHFAYILEGIKELSTIQSYAIGVTADGVSYDDEYVFGAVCNSTSVAGLVKLNEKLVDMSDGMFEVVLVRRPKDLADLSKILIALNTGDFQNNEMIRFFKAKTISFKTKKKMPWSLDGEFEDGACAVTIQNKAGGIILKH